MSLEMKINNWENTLSLYAAIPLFGILPGALKVAGGVVQTVSAVALSILFSAPALCQNEQSKEIFFRACKHIPHGLGNIVAGTVEGCPIIGSIFVALRFMRTSRDIEPPSTLCDTYDTMEHPAFKFYPYEHNTRDRFRHEVEGDGDLLYGLAKFSRWLKDK